MSVRKDRKKNTHIQNNMYEGKSSKSIYKGLISSLFLLASLLFFGVLFYQNILEYEKGLTTESILFWLYKNSHLNFLILFYVLCCFLILIIGVLDVKRLKKLRNKKA